MFLIAFTLPTLYSQAGKVMFERNEYDEYNVHIVIAYLNKSLDVVS